MLSTSLPPFPSLLGAIPFSFCLNLDLDFLSLVKKKKLSQAQFASLIDSAQSTISGLMTAGIISKSGNWLTWTRQYIHYLQEAAAGRDSELTKEATRLKKMQADRIQFELQERIKKVLHIDSFTIVLITHNSMLRNRLLALPHKLKSLIPYLQPKDVLRIDEEVRQALTEMGSYQLPQKIIDRVQEIEREGWGDILEDHQNGNHSTKSATVAHLPCEQPILRKPQPAEA